MSRTRTRLTVALLAAAPLLLFSLWAAAQFPTKPSGVADGSVTAAKIADGAITTAKLADGAVTATQIGTGAVTAAKIPAGEITADKLVSPLTGIRTVYIQGSGSDPLDIYNDLRVVSGVFRNGVSGSETSTIGADGAASVLTVHPLGYLTIKLNDGSSVKVPYYNP